MYTLRSIGVLSCAKIMGAIYGSLGLLILPFLLLGGFAGLMAGKGSEATGIAMLALAAFAPVFYGALGFLMAAFSAWIYNLFARWLGGIRLELRAEVAGSPTTQVTS